MATIIERIPPLDEHDRQKVVRLRGRAEGSPEAAWKTATIDVAAILAKPERLDAVVMKLKADCEEYYARYTGLADMIDEKLRQMGVKEIEDAPVKESSKERGP